MSNHPALRKTTLLGSLGAVLALVIAALLASAGPAPEHATAQATGQKRPNIVVIQTDDESWGPFFATYVDANGVHRRVMPRTLDEIRKAGVMFNRYYVTYPTCCPSRTTLLSGRYAHTHGVISNGAPRGGWPGFQKQAVYNHNIAVWLQRAGYRTYHYGKFLNQYGIVGAPETEVPPGWTDWASDAIDLSTRQFYGYTLNVNGQLQGPFGDPEYGQGENQDPLACGPAVALGPVCNYQTDTMTRRALDQIAASTPGGPFYLQVDYIAPHGDHRQPIGPEPATRHYDSAINTPLPKPRGLFNEGNISDKPSFIRDQANYLDPVTIRRIRREYQKSLESLRAVDDGIGLIVDALRASGELRNTYIFVLSDNGFFFGEHRLERSKFLPYEPATHMPLFVRGPGITPSSVSSELVGNIDLAPTIVELAKAHNDRGFDGRSLVDFWQDPSLHTRRPVLLESFAKATDIDGDGDIDFRHAGDRDVGRRDRPQAGISIQAPVENYLGIRLGPYKYVEYETGDFELYDLSKDPKELNNRYGDPRYRKVQARLHYLLVRLEDCHGAECRVIPNQLPRVGFSQRR
jgi:arylsulfatase A-like enzyme